MMDMAEMALLVYIWVKMHIFISIPYICKAYIPYIYIYRKNILEEYKSNYYQRLAFGSH